MAVRKPTRGGRPRAGVLSYRNRKGVEYYLHEGRTKTGKPRFFFARSVREGACAEMPAGFEVAESINGVVSARRIDPNRTTVPAKDLELVEKELQRHAHLSHHRVQVEKDAVVVYEPNTDVEAILEIAGGLGPPDFGARAATERLLAHVSFSPVMRFEPYDESYAAKRMTYRGQGGWSWPIAFGSIGSLARKLIRHIGTDEFFELM